MTLQIRDFSKDDFAEYRSWFSDDRLRTALEGVDDEWLDHVLHDPAGKQFVVVDTVLESIVAVVGVCLPNHENPLYVITDIGVRPDVRGRGIGRASVKLAMDQFPKLDEVNWCAYVSRTNSDAQLFFRSLGWLENSRSNDEMHMFVRRRIANPARR